MVHYSPFTNSIRYCIEETGTERIILSPFEKYSMLIWLCASQLSPCFLSPSFFLTPSAVSVPLRSNHCYEHCEPFTSAFENLVFGKNKQMRFDVIHALSTSTRSNLGFLKSMVSKLGRLCWPSSCYTDFILLIFIITSMLRTYMKLIRHSAGLLPPTCATEALS